MFKNLYLLKKLFWSNTCLRNFLGKRIPFSSLATQHVKLELQIRTYLYRSVYKDNSRSPHNVYPRYNMFYGWQVSVEQVSTHPSFGTSTNPDALAAKSTSIIDTLEVAFHCVLNLKVSQRARKCLNKLIELPVAVDIWECPTHIISIHHNVVITLQGINISHLGKWKIIFKMPFLGDMLVPWRVVFFLSWFHAKDFPSISMQQPMGGPQLLFGATGPLLACQLGHPPKLYGGSRIGLLPEKWAAWYTLIHLGEAQN